ncbi:MAG: hypothetical protein ABIR66_13375 [Saprospiraceae bacterium]
MLKNRKVKMLSDQSLTKTLDDIAHINRKRRFVLQQHNLFLLAALICFLVPFVFLGSRVGFNFIGDHHTVSGEYFIQLLASFFILNWITYVFTSKYLYAYNFIAIHVILTFIVIVFVIVYLWHFKPDESNKIEALFLGFRLSVEVRELKFTSPGAIIFLVAQLTYLGNLCVGIWNKKRSKY